MRFPIRRTLGWAAVGALAAAFVGIILTSVVGTATPRPDRAALGGIHIADVLFYAVAGMTVAGAAAVALSRNVLYSSLGLLAALLGTGALYVLLSADFLAVTQLLVYVGGVLVLILFAVMLTSRIKEIDVSNASVGALGGAVVATLTAFVLILIATRTPWAAGLGAPLTETSAAIGNAFLTRWLLPFEVASLVLLATLVGSVVIARKELKED